MNYDDWKLSAPPTERDLEQEFEDELTQAEEKFEQLRDMAGVKTPVCRE